jgi:hypothetical protein
MAGWKRREVRQHSSRNDGRCYALAVPASAGANLGEPDCTRYP